MDFTLSLKILLCLALAAATAALQQWFRWLFAGKLLRRQPGPIPIPLLGNLLHLISSPLPHRTLHVLARKHGPIFYLHLGSVTTVVASTSAAARQILSAHDKSLSSRPSFKTAHRLFYSTDKTAFMCPYGDQWRFTRKFYASQIFSPRALQQLHLPIIRDEIHRTIMGDLYEASRVGADVNLTKLFITLAQNIIYRVALGKRPTEISHATTTDAYELVEEIEQILSSSAIGDFIPTLSFLDYGIKRAVDRCNRKIDVMMEAVITERGERRETDASHDHEVGRRSILDVMLASEPPLDRVKIKSMLMEVIAAGGKTMATVLDWAMAELANNETAMRKAVEEIDGVVGRERMMTLEDVRDKMPYIQAVVKETLRLHPSAPLMLPHEALESCDVKMVHDAEVRSYRIAAGSRVVINAWAIGRDEATWGATAAAFAPERFLEGGPKHEVNVRGQHFELLPFGSGRRMCPGRPSATIVLELALATFLHCFEWKSRDTPVDMSEYFGLNVSRRWDHVAVPGPFRLKGSRRTSGFEMGDVSV